MSKMKVCSRCGKHSESEYVFCGFCGEPLGEDIKLIVELDNYFAEQKGHRSGAKIRQQQWQEPPVYGRKVAEEEGSRFYYEAPEEKSYTFPMLIVSIIGVAAGVFFLL